MIDKPKNTHGFQFDAMFADQLSSVEISLRMCNSFNLSKLVIIVYFINAINGNIGEARARF